MASRSGAIHFTTSLRLLLLIGLCSLSGEALAFEQLRFVSDTALQEAPLRAAPAQTEAATLPEKSRPPKQPELTPIDGLIMLDYELIPVPGTNPIDLLGLHYLHPLNSWLYFGLGLHAPLFNGNYGGFMAFDATMHAQQQVIGNWFVDAGVSFGGGGGGSTVKQSRQLSGKGQYIKGYAGLGYRFDNFSAGLNYTHFRFVNSLINHAQLNLFIQKPVSFAIAPYRDAGSYIEQDLSLSSEQETVLSFELNNLLQIRPQGLNKGTINAVELQIARFISDQRYLYFALDVGYQGLPLYNQIILGIGQRFEITPDLYLSGQLGIGSGGYAPDEVDTDSGLLLYPKLAMEYMLNNKIGLSLSGGYLIAPNGSSRNVTLGAALNYHLGNGGTFHGGSASERLLLRGFRFHTFLQREFAVSVGGRDHKDIDLLGFQLDYMVGDHLYIPLQASIAVSDFMTYPGYGELLSGLGVQASLDEENRLQAFVQLMVGANGHGVVIKPAAGFHYGISDHLALNAHFGRIMSLHKIGLYPDIRRFSAYSAGAGFTYRFSFADSVPR